MADSTKNIQMLGSDKEFLRLRQRPSLAEGDPIRIVDLFSGCGGITLGAAIAAHDLGFKLEIPLAIDFDSAAVECYKKNFPTANAECADLTTVFEGDLSAPLSLVEKKLRKSVGSVDILVGGPPCQGHSDLNNFTRRNDPKNQLMQIMARAAVVLRPNSIVIENVVGSLKDDKGVVHNVESIFKRLGYTVSVGIMDCSAFGVPQRRKRMIMIATQGDAICLDSLLVKFGTGYRSIKWAIKDIMNVPRDSLVDKIAVSQPQTKIRIDYLFDNELYELPNAQRPPCHRDKKHSYDTVYGRLRWNDMSQTITSGFYSMCMGRYVHPEQRRTLTAHEAARLQFFPDFYDFSPAKSRTKIAGIIGNAVPPKAAYVIVRALISSLKKISL